MCTQGAALTTTGRIEDNRSSLCFQFELGTKLVDSETRGADKDGRHLALTTQVTVLDVIRTHENVNGATVRI